MSSIALPRRADPSPSRPPLELDLPIPTSALVAIVRGLAAAPSLWEPLVRHDPDERFATKLLETVGYDVWLIGWWPGQRVGLHDHGGATGALTVVSGTLVDATLVDGHLERCLVRQGDTRRLAPTVIHDVQNAGTAVATSIHAYSPPLTTMGFYDEGGRPSRSEAIAATAPALPGARLAHPSLHG